ncbi:MAG: endolytic transglycosylase MltG [Bacteroidales bacterium]|nr:endolytic transglycosylase MltG [Bacteroidales bacterium]
MKKTILHIFLTLVGLAICAACIVAYIIFGPNTKNKSDIVIHIPRHCDYEQLLDSLEAHDVLRSEETFDMVAHYMKYKTVRVGHYTIKPKTSNFHLVRLLRKGQHYPVKFAFNNIRTIDQFAERAGKVLFFEPADLANLLHNNEFLSQYDLNVATCPALFIPDNYEFFYDITPEDFIERFHSYYKHFWNEERLKMADSIGLTPTEVVTLASIVEEENFRPQEKAIIAGLYINRLKKNMLLQSDPTVKFALGDFSRQRILLEDLKVDSPYNTYRFKGLPPGPIRFPEQSTVDSVLHYTHHNYLYMCAKEDFSGYHNFTSSAAVHKKNAALYRKALNERNIKK